MLMQPRFKLPQGRFGAKYLEQERGFAVSYCAECRAADGTSLHTGGFIRKVLYILFGDTSHCLIPTVRSQLFLMLLAMCLVLGLPLSVSAEDRPARRGEAVRSAMLKKQKDKAATERNDMLAKARKSGMKTRGLKNGSHFELVGFENNHPLYYQVFNADAAISLGVNLLYPSPIYDLNGDGVIVGVWDAGRIKGTHQEFDSPSRVTWMTNEPNSAHATHVGGTIGAAGVVARAKGMAPQSQIWSYYMGQYGTSEYLEMAAVGATEPGQTDHIYLSNHSYGFACGWSWNGTVAEWMGSSLSLQRDEKFGRYGPISAAWDGVCWDDPYYLPFKAAGNDRDDPAPAPGQAFFRMETQGGNTYEQWYVYDPNVYPPADGAWFGGYDTIPDVGTAKNVMTVGAVDDAVTAGVRDISKAMMSTFSGWGPTDDGRIKPDIVANGVSLYSPGWSAYSEPNYVAQSNTSYYTMSGTSMASPNACGAAALLVQLYGRLFPSQAMRSSTLKGLIIHTADDLGNPGPDYTYGWGLMNAKAAADLIIRHQTEPLANTIYEGTLGGPQSVDSYTFMYDGSSTVRVTLCWTDLAAGSTLFGEITTPRLLHDLDIRVLDSNGVIGQPYVLDPAHPDWPATRGDNHLDNVEQVDVSPGLLHSMFTVRVSMKNNSSGGRQVYSLIVTGQRLEPHPVLIKGKVADSTTGLGVAGVSVNGEPGGLAATTNSHGDYELAVPYGWKVSPLRGTVTPSKYGYEIVPATRDYNDVTMDIDGQDYTASAIMPLISGLVRDSNSVGVSGVEVTSNPNVGTAYTDPNGGYYLAVPYGYTGVLSPIKDGLTFLPASKDYNDVTTNYPGQDYTASGVFYRLSGRVVDASGGGLAGAVIVADPNDGAVFTDSGGNYYFDVARHFHGTLAPVKYGYLMQPVSRYYPDVTEPISGQDYAIETKLYDGFADNRKSAAWLVHNGQPGALNIVEQGYRLNIVADDPNNTEVFYRGNGWQIDPNNSIITMKVDFHIGVSDVGEPNDAWVTFGIDNAVGSRAAIFAGCAGGQRYFGFKAFVGGNSYSAQTPRTANDGTLYITYDTSLDELYMSYIEYGKANAWQTIPNAFGASYRPYVTVFIGGGGKGVDLAYGQAWFDNFEINYGILTGWPPAVDIDHDGYIGWGDIGLLAEHWLESYPACDINKDGIVNFMDFALVVAGW
jgi:hypothetical protein